VVFTADHGEMLGERGLWYKMTFFEWSARVPLIFHWPQRWKPQRISRGVSLVDIMPTLHDIAGCTAEDIGPARPEGTSLLPALEGRDWKNDDVRVEYLSEAALDPRLMVRRGDLKYVFSQTDPVELYDLAEDPHELVNLAGNPDYAAQERALHDAVMARWQPDELKREVMESQQRRLYIHRTLTTGRYTPWDFQPQMDASRAYVRNLGVDEDTLKARSRLPKAPSVEPDFEA
ncbi:MAG: sulfatase-like hydrolase/transferase, partial [Acidihalobacter sp.]